MDRSYRRPQAPFTIPHCQNEFNNYLHVQKHSSNHPDVVQAASDGFFTCADTVLEKVAFCSGERHLYKRHLAVGEKSKYLQLALLEDVRDCYMKSLVNPKSVRVFQHFVSPYTSGEDLENFAAAYENVRAGDRAVADRQFVQSVIKQDVEK